MIQSPLNYTGGKYKLLPQILPLFPKDIDVFVDLFCGGCNVGINVDCNWVIYNDLNENLLYLYNTFKNLDKKSVLEWIYEIIEKYNLSLVSKHGYDYYGCESSKGLGNYNREGYLRLRADFNQKHANENFDYYYYVMLYVIIVYAFNNQIRFNSNGEFNLPVGKRDFNKKMEQKLIDFIDKIQSQNCTFTCCDFREFDKSALTSQDFVYIDPPYLITCATYNEQGGWSEADEKDLLTFLDELNGRNIRFALSNVLRSKGKENNILIEWLEKKADNYTVIPLNYSYSNSNYVNVDSLFSEGEVNYTCFDNKQIYSIKELIQQERTVWFVRESKDTDSQNEIVLLNSDYVQPNNFSKKYFQSHGSSLLWLSDLHLADSDFSVDNDETTKSLFEHIQGCLSNVQDEIGGLIITGDITSTAEKNGFEKATKLIDDLSRNYVFTNENIAICPGNHDFKFSQKDLDVDEKPKAVSKLYTKAYSNFYKSVYNISPNEYYCCGKKILLSSGHVVEIVALNSLYLQQHQNFNGHGYLSEKQLNFVATEMGWNNKKARNVIRIVMMHHHYLPVCYTEAIDVKRASSVVYDADRLMNWMIKHDVKVLLHGHKHKSIVAQVTYPDTSFSNENNETQMKKISVIGMGGTGCKHTQNLFGTLGFDDNKLYIKFYQIYSDESSEDSEYQTIVLPLER